jgi:hypothetical protein
MANGKGFKMNKGYLYKKDRRASKLVMAQAKSLTVMLFFCEDFDDMLEMDDFHGDFYDDLYDIPIVAEGHDEYDDFWLEPDHGIHESDEDYLRNSDYEFGMSFEDATFDLMPTSCN